MEEKEKGMRVGYARVSTVGQKLDVQLDRLSDCDRIFKEKVSAGTRDKRLELKKALDFVREGDVLIVTKLDRLARSVVDLSNIVQLLEEKDVDLVVLDQGINTTTIYGRLQFNILAAIGEFERGLITERSREGREKAIANGVRFGVRAKLSDDEIDEMVRLFETDELSKNDISEIYAISRSSVYRLYAEYKQDQTGVFRLKCFKASVLTHPTSCPRCVTYKKSATLIAYLKPNRSNTALGALS
jgi:DNA invertase Pin-like site-specific DNA recombinase